MRSIDVSHRPGAWRPVRVDPAIVVRGRRDWHLARRGRRRQLALGPRAIWLRIGAGVTVLLTAFFFLQHPARTLETRADAGTLQLLGFHGVALVSGTSVYVEPGHYRPFWIELSPSCSSLASVLTLACLGAMLPRAMRPARRIALAYGAAAAAVVLGNLVRIDSSMVAGLLFGQSALVLFHDTAASVFGFAYALGGFVLMLWLLLPDRRAATREG